MAETARTIGERVRRREDPALVTGSARFTADVRLENPLWLGVARSPYPHAEIVSIDADAARRMPGVVRAFTAADVLPTLGRSFPFGRTPTGGAFRELREPKRWPIADRRARAFGQPVAFVAAETAAQAQDAALALAAAVEYRELPGSGDARTARSAAEDGATPIHEEAPGNLAFTWVLDPEDDPASAPLAFEFEKDPPIEVALDFRIPRLIPTAMEPRAVAAAPDGDRITIWTSTQAPHRARADLARILDVAPERIRVVAPEVGGGFGAKANLYEEEALVPWLALRTGRPVRWTATRAEDFATTSHGRNQFAALRVSAAADGRLLHLDLSMLFDCGAGYSRPGPTTPSLTGSMLPGPYLVPTVRARADGAFTNTAPNEPYRGSGRPEATYLIERAMDVLAGRLGLDPVEIRRRNLIPKDAFPHRTATGLDYDSGDYRAALDMALEAADYDGLREEQRKRREAAKSGDSGSAPLLGVGVACYVEICGFGPWEAGGVSVEADGSVTVRSGTSPHGQGHETAWAQIAAGMLGIPPERIRVLHGDTDECPRGIGTFGSRSAAVGGSAIAGNAKTVRERAKEIAAHLLEAAAWDVRLEDGWFSVAGAPGRRVSWSDVARLAHDPDAPEEFRGALAADEDFRPAGDTFPFGAHVAVVEIAPDTGVPTIRRYVSVDDCGNLINPLLAEGQVHGGIAQGVAQALYEEAVYDSGGNLLTASLMEYAAPRADMLPEYELRRTVTPTPLNPLGAKGIGEAATIGSTPAVANAVMDALRPFGVEHLDCPLTPEKIWRAMNGLSDGTD